MKRGYYPIPPVDMSLNSQQFYQASVIGDIKFDWKKSSIEFQIDKYFPVGSIFHFIHNTVDYIITCRINRPGLYYRARRKDGCKLDSKDIERFNSGRFLYRNGFIHSS